MTAESMANERLNFLILYHKCSAICNSVPCFFGNQGKSFPIQQSKKVTFILIFVILIILVNLLIYLIIKKNKINKLLKQKPIKKYYEELKKKDTYFPIEKISPNLRTVVIALEDNNFYKLLRYN